MLALQDAAKAVVAARNKAKKDRRKEEDPAQTEVETTDSGEPRKRVSFA